MSDRHLRLPHGHSRQTINLIDAAGDLQVAGEYLRRAIFLSGYIGRRQRGTYDHGEENCESFQKTLSCEGLPRFRIPFYQRASR